MDPCPAIKDHCGKNRTGSGGGSAGSERTVKKEDIMKKLCLMMVASVFMLGSVCYGSITPPRGYGQIGLGAVVLCSSLTFYADPGRNPLQTLSYGDRPIVMSREDGWANVVLGDSEDSPSGWVNEAFLAVDPAWYQTEGSTFVYAWNDTSAPMVALLDEGTTLPVLRDDGDWIVVSLRGAAGWINLPDRDTRDEADE